MFRPILLLEAELFADKLDQHMNILQCKYRHSCIIKVYDGSLCWTTVSHQTTFSVWTNVAIVHWCETGWWIERVEVAENGLQGSMYIVKYMNRLEFSSNMDVSYFYKMDYVNIAE